MLYNNKEYTGRSFAHRFDITFPYPHHINAIHLYCNDSHTLQYAPAEFFVTAVDSSNRLVPLVRERYHNLLCTLQRPYWMKLKTNYPIQRLFIDVLSRN